MPLTPQANAWIAYVEKAKKSTADAWKVYQLKFINDHQKATSQDLRAMNEILTKAEALSKTLHMDLTAMRLELEGWGGGRNDDWFKHAKAEMKHIQEMARR
jgi:hypothetical protein